MADDQLLLGLRVGVPDAEVLGAFLANEKERHSYRPAMGLDARVILGKSIASCLADQDGRAPSAAPAQIPKHLPDHFPTHLASRPETN